MTFRPNTKLPEIKVAFIYNCGGMGDFIHWTKAIEYAIRENSHLYGYIVSPPFFIELAKYWFSWAEKFEVVEKVPTESIGAIPIGPNRYQIVNSSTFHLMQLGFVFYNRTATVPPECSKLPRIEGNEVSLDKFPLPEKYAVIPVMATAPNRQFPQHLITPLMDYLIERGITPVVLGKQDLTDTYKASSVVFDPDKVIDLREKTTLLEAACIMNQATCVIGMDSGLLHLAACSDDVPILWIFTVVDPRFRLMNRKGKQLAIVPGEKLECRFCETQMRFLPPGTDSRRCIYKDYKCLVDIVPDEIIDATRELLDGE